MQNHILDSIFRIESLNTSDSQQDFLQNLQSYVKFLRSTYQNQFINVNYDRKLLQYAYLLAYYPSYTKVIQEILASIERDFEISPLVSDNLNISFIGPGPGPEISGLFGYFRQRDQIINGAIVNTFDKHSTSWQNALNITFSGLYSLYGYANVAHNPIEIDLTEVESFLVHREIFEISDIIIAQNCLNEMPATSHDIVSDNISYIVSCMKPKAVLLIIDLRGYTGVTALVRKTEEKCMENTNDRLIRSVLDPELVCYTHSLKNVMPQMVKDYLLTGVAYTVENGLIPKTSVNYKYCAFQKSGGELESAD